MARPARLRESERHPSRPPLRTNVIARLAAPARSREGPRFAAALDAKALSRRTSTHSAGSAADSENFFPRTDDLRSPHARRDVPHPRSVQRARHLRDGHQRPGSRATLLWIFVCAPIYRSRLRLARRRRSARHRNDDLARLRRQSPAQCDSCEETRGRVCVHAARVKTSRRAAHRKNVSLLSENAIGRKSS